ncbi:MAG: hypothetical protein E7408_01745 [Ruminococcaceae bacterium]|nr:hypothetical protein [Oscillospiraceae bacterium]
MKGFRKTVGLLLCICMFASLGMGAAAEEVISPSDLADGTAIIEVTPDSEGYAPPQGFDGSYMKIVQDTAFNTPIAGNLEAGETYSLSFRYKATGAVRSIRLYVYHVNSEENGGKAVDISSYVNSKGYVTISCAEGTGNWQTYATTIAIPDYFTKDVAELEEKGIYKTASHVAIKLNVRAGSAMEIANMSFNTNKVANYDFEGYDAESLATAPAGWTWGTNDNGALEEVAVENGNAFVRLVPNDVSVKRMPAAQQTLVGLKPSTQYRLSFKFRTTSVTAGYARPCVTFIEYYTPLGETAERKTSVEYSQSGFRYAPTFSDFGDRSVTSTKDGTKSYYNKTEMKLADATPGTWTDYTVYFTTPATADDDTLNVVLYLQGDGNGKLADGTTFAEFCYDNVILEEDYTEVKLYNAAGTQVEALTAGEEGKVVVHYVPKTLCTETMDVFLAVYAKKGTVKSLKDVDIISAAPAGAVTFAESASFTPSPLCILPQEYELTVNVPSKSEGDITVTALLFDNIADMNVTEKFIIPVK